MCQLSEQGTDRLHRKNIGKCRKLYCELSYEYPEMFMCMVAGEFVSAGM